jgi:hypothetical protein
MNGPGTKSPMPADRREIESFVRGVLGCGCPDEVFDSLVLAPPCPDRGAPGPLRLLVGGRLLIYVVDAPDTEGLEADIAALSARGRAERDEAGYHRFRLVALTEPGSFAATLAEAAFRASVAGDQRAHLHCVEAASVPRALLPAATGRPAAASR